MKCARPGCSYEFRCQAETAAYTDGYCSNACRDLHAVERERDEARAALNAPWKASYMAMRDERDEWKEAYELERRRSEMYRQKRDEARKHARDHHLEACETCMACDAQRDEALAEVERLRADRDGCAESDRMAHDRIERLVRENDRLRAIMAGKAAEAEESHALAALGGEARCANCGSTKAQHGLYLNGSYHCPQGWLRKEV